MLYQFMFFRMNDLETAGLKVGGLMSDRCLQATLSSTSHYRIMSRCSDLQLKISAGLEET